MVQPIWVVCKDPGGTNNALPVARELRSRNIPTQLIANGKAIEILGKLNELFLAYDSAEELVSDRGLPRLLITSMCSGGGIGRDLVPLARDKVKTIALQDFWGARLWTDWADAKFIPDYICVNDEIGKQIVLDAWRAVSPAGIKVLGYPALDKYANYDSAAISAKTKTALGMIEQKPVILVGGQGAGTASMLTEIIAALNEIKKDCYVIPRPHPRTKDDFRDEMALWQTALAQLKCGTPIFDFFGQTDTPSLIATADLIISTFSTILVEAAALRKPNISVLYPDNGMKQWDAAMDGKIKEFPLIELGCSAKATNRHELISFIKSAFSGSLNLRQVQERHFRLDGKNAKHIADFALSLL